MERAALLARTRVCGHFYVASREVEAGLILRPGALAGGSGSVSACPWVYSVSNFRLA